MVDPFSVYACNRCGRAELFVEGIDEGFRSEPHR